MGTAEKTEDPQMRLTNAAINKAEQQEYTKQLDTSELEPSKERAAISASCLAILSGSVPDFPIRGTDTPEMQKKMIDLNWASQNIDVANEMIDYYTRNPDSSYLRDIPKVVENAYGDKRTLPGLTKPPSCYYLQSEPRGYVSVVDSDSLSCWKKFGLFFQQQRYDGILYGAEQLCQHERELYVEEQKNKVG